MSEGHGHLWGVILAGGNGERLQGFIKRLYGRNLPKQYCAITGTRSLLQHTLDRAKLLIPKERVLTLVAQEHSRYVAQQLADQPPETIIIQPCSRETGPALFLSLLQILRRDPSSTVAVFPSDHFIKEELRFIGYVAGAASFVQSHPDRLVMLGVKPERIESGYGYIERGEVTARYGTKEFHRVVKFWEKPDSAEATALHSQDCLWNTLILIGRGATFMKHIRAQMPEVVKPFEVMDAAFNFRHEQEFVQNVFPSLPTVNFSRAVLEQIPDHLCVMEMDDVYWNDWGEECRIKRDVERFKLRERSGLAQLGKEELWTDEPKRDSLFTNGRTK